METRKNTDSIRSLKHCLAPVVALLITAGFVYLASVFKLPEKHQAYYTFLLIVAFLFALYYVIITAPCAFTSLYLAVKAIVNDKQYILPIIVLALDCAMLVTWVMVVYKWIMV